MRCCSSIGVEAPARTARFAICLALPLSCGQSAIEYAGLVPACVSPPSLGPFGRFSAESAFLAKFAKI